MGGAMTSDALLGWRKVGGAYWFGVSQMTGCVGRYGVPMAPPIGRGGTCSGILNEVYIPSVGVDGCGAQRDGALRTVLNDGGSGQAVSIGT